MLSSVQKNSIVKSYASVLYDVLLNATENDAEALQVVRALVKSSSSDSIFVNPINMKEYKKVIGELSRNLANSGELENFFIQILDRKYFNLLGEILALVENKICRHSNEKKIIIRSKDELSDHAKEEIQKALKNQGIEANVQYEQNQYLETENVEFISNGKVCTLSMANLLNKIFVA